MFHEAKCLKEAQSAGLTWPGLQASMLKGYKPPFRDEMLLHKEKSDFRPSVLPGDTVLLAVRSHMNWRLTKCEIRFKELVELATLGVGSVAMRTLMSFPNMMQINHRVRPHPVSKEANTTINVVNWEPAKCFQLWSRCYCTTLMFESGSILIGPRIPLHIKKKGGVGAETLWQDPLFCLQYRLCPPGDWWCSRCRESKT